MDVRGVGSVTDLSEGETLCGAASRFKLTHKHGGAEVSPSLYHSVRGTADDFDSLT